MHSIVSFIVSCRTGYTLDTLAAIGIFFRSVASRGAAQAHRTFATPSRTRERMIRKKLIEPFTADGDIITDFGMDVIDEGGWIKFKEATDQNVLREAKPTIINLTGDIGHIQKNYGTVHGSMTSDSSQNKTTITPAKADSSISKKIFIGVIVGLIVALILYFVFGIKT